MVSGSIITILKATLVPYSDYSWDVSPASTFSKRLVDGGPIRFEVSSARLTLQWESIWDLDKRGHGRNNSFKFCQSPSIDIYHCASLEITSDGFRYHAL